jgi:membrane fusion protein, multidrug efflux system
VVGADAHLHLREVEVAAFGPDSVTLDGGLAAGERCVAQGVHMLTDGQAVQAVAPLHPEDFAS